MATERALQRPIAPQARPWTAGLVLLALGLVALGMPVLGGLCGVLAAANLAFFRNPRRHPPGGERLAVSPADGRVVEAELLEERELEVEKGPGVDLNDLFQQLDRQGIKVVSLRNKVNRLEELFLRLVDDNQPDAVVNQ